MKTIQLDLTGPITATEVPPKYAKSMQKDLVCRNASTGIYMARIPKQLIIVHVIKKTVHYYLTQSFTEF
jgi:hypothetical protein